MNQNFFILMSLLLGPAGFLGMLYCYRKAYNYAGETYKSQQKIHALESELFVLSNKNQQQSIKLAEALEEKNATHELNRQTQEILDSINNDHNSALEQINQLQRTVSILQSSQKKLEESFEMRERNYKSEIESLGKKALYKKQENESLKKDLDSTRSKWEQTIKETLEKENRLKQLEDDLASEKQKLCKSDEYNLEILAEMVVIQGELKTLREHPKEDQVIAHIKSELAKALHTSAEVSEKLEHQREKTSVIEEELRKAKEINSKWETTIRTMAEHIIGRKNRGLENQSLSELITNANAAINRTKVLQDVQQSEKNQSEELDFLAKLTAQSGLYRSTNPSKEKY